MAWRFTPVGVDVFSHRGGVTIASGGLSVLLGPLNLLRYPTITFTLYNPNFYTLSGAVIQVNPDDVGIEPGLVPAVPAGSPTQIGPNPALWYDYDATTFKFMTSGQLRHVVAAGPHRWWRVLAANYQTPALSVSGWVNAATI